MSRTRVHTSDEEVYTLPFTRPNDWDLAFKAGCSVLGMASQVLTLFVITTYMTLSSTYWYGYPALVRIMLQSLTMVFPLVATLLISDLKTEYAFREWVSYKMLDEAVLVVFDEPTHPVLVARSSPISIYIAGSLSLLLVTALSSWQAAPVAIVCALSMNLIYQVYSSRQLEPSLISLHRFAKGDPTKSAAFLTDVSAGGRVLNASKLQLRCTAAKLRHAQVDLELKEARAREAAHQKLSAEGFLVDFKGIARELSDAWERKVSHDGEASDSATEDGDARRAKAVECTGAEDAATLKHLEAELGKRSIIERVRAAGHNPLSLARWAVNNRFARTEDATFAVYMQWLRHCALGLALLVEGYGIYALTTGTSVACLAGSSSTSD
jgi:hypothetical protein